MTSLKELFLLDPETAYLNHGSFGATPELVFQEYQRWQRELERQPTEFLGRRHDGLMRSARGALAAFVGASDQDLVFVQNATQAINIVAHSMSLGPSDEVLSSDHEYGACDRTWRFLSRKHGFRYIQRPIRLPLVSREAIVRDLLAGVTSRTRVVFISHITSPTAVRFPVEEICREARAAGILTIVDGAHGPGQIPLDLEAVGADFYAGNLHKWLCAPKGAGFLHARPEAQSLIEPLVVSWGYESDAPSGSEFIDHLEWWGTRDIAAFLSVPAAIEFQREHDWNAVQSKCHEMLREALASLSRITGMQSVYPDDSWYAQMGVAPLPETVNASALQARLFDEFGVEVPVRAWNGRVLLRLSLQAYNTNDDTDRLMRALQALL